MEFGVEIGEYRGVVTIHPPARVPAPAPGTPRPERCVEPRYRLANRVREHRRAEAAPEAVNRGRECGDQRARPVPTADSRRSPGFPQTAAVDPKRTTGLSHDLLKIMR